LVQPTFAALFASVSGGTEIPGIKRTPPKVEALNIQHKVEKSTTTRENRVYFVFFRREEAKGHSKF